MLVKISILVAFFGLSFIGCNSNAFEPLPEKETATVKDFIFTYSAEWDYTSIPWNTTILNADTVFVINTQVEFDKYFPTATSKPENFTDYSLLFVYGKTTTKIVETSHDIVSETNRTYRLDVDIELGAAQAPDVWYVSILVPKIPGVSVIPLKKTLSGVPENSNEESPYDNYRGNIPGQWKLVADSIQFFKDGTLSEVKYNDYSDKNIIYDFQEGDILLINGTGTDLYTKGQHTYKYSISETGGNLQIDGNKNDCRALSSSEAMTVQVEKGTAKYTLSFVKTNSEPNSGDDGDDGNIRFVEIKRDILYGAGREGISKQDLVIKNQPEWTNLQAKINSSNHYDITETEIDFAKYTVIAVFDEVKNNGGWSIDITDISVIDDKVIVTVSNLKKGNSTAVITQPFHIVKIPVSENKIDFKHN
jgi:hypothetical protein